mgnify:FL=1
MFSALTKGIRQLSDPTTRQLVWLSIGIAILTFLILFGCIEMALRFTSIFHTGWMEAIADILGRLAGGILTWLLFPAAISAVVGLFLERAVRTVEARHYPALPPIEDRPPVESLLTAGKFLVILVALNLALLFFIFTGPLYLILYYLVNGYLISREFFELVAVRRIDSGLASALRKQFQAPLLIMGTIFAFLMTIPIVNLLTPIIATATMVHLFEKWRAHDDGALVTT